MADYRLKDIMNPGLPVTDFPTTSTPKHGSANMIRPPDISKLSIVDDELFVAVLGKSGTGKSTFINLASSSALRISSGLQSCTEKVELSLPFFLEGRCIRLIDTPGFDDSSKSDSDILNTIATFFASEYSCGRKLAGIIYLHTISSPRMGAISHRNLVMFQKLCGIQAVKNVALVTTHWDEVQAAVGEAREQELCNNTAFFLPMLEAGASLFRYDRTLASAQKIVRHLLTTPPLALLVQTEMVDEGKLISETAAGMELQREFRDQQLIHEDNMRALKEELAELSNGHDSATVHEIEAEMNSLQIQVIRLEQETRKLAIKSTPQPPHMLISSITSPVISGINRPTQLHQSEEIDSSTVPPLHSNAIAAVLDTTPKIVPSIVTTRNNRPRTDVSQQMLAHHSHPPATIPLHRERTRTHARRHGRRHRHRHRVNSDFHVVWDGWGDFRVLLFVIALLIIFSVLKKFQLSQY